MTPFLDVPFRPEETYIEFLNKNSAHIDSIHFSLMGDKRMDNRIDVESIDETDTLIGLLRQLTVSDKYVLLNSIFYGPSLFTDVKQLRPLIHCLDKCVNAGMLKGIIYCDQYLLQSLSNEAPSLVAELEAIPGINTMLDSQAKISSHLAYIGETNFRLPSKLVLDRSLNRNLEKLTDTVHWCRQGFPDMKLELLANEGCLPFCPYRASHDAYIALGNHEGDDNSFYINKELGCMQLLEKQPHRLLQSPFIRPEDVDSYQTHVDLILLCGRAQGAAFLQKTINAYIQRSYEGNLLELLDSMNWLAEQMHVENAALSFDFANMLSVCNNRCNSCGFCIELFQAIARPTPHEKIENPVEALS
ncbi:MAG: hypothetical protein D3924_02055 [Candidatus Electrothrix sp. AR4]|nr:hypothetical protein [Candidatus Electrothrix sp. AR4]